MAKAATEVAELFAKHFPRSLPVLGPLVGIVQSGALLPFYLAQGILNGIGFVRDAAMALASKFSEVFQAGVDTRLKATKLGISAEAVSGLDAVFKRFGSSFSEAEFPLAKLNDAIAKGTPEDIAKFEALGISMEKIKASSDPAIAAMLSLSDVLETSKQGSIAYTTALELMGLMASSNLVIGLRQGSGVIRGEFNNAVERGVVVTTKFADASLKFKQIFDKLKDTAQSVLANVLGPILPELSQVADSILALFTTYRVEIAAFLELLGQAVGVVVSLVTKIVTAAITQPGKMLGSLKIMGKAVMAFVGELFKTIADFILNNVVMVGGILFQSTLAVAAQIFNEVGAALSPYLDFAIVAVEKFMLDALASVVNKFGDFLRKIPEFGLKLLIALGSLFTDLARYINTQLQKLLIGALASLSDYISKSPNLTKVINFLGLKEVTDNLQEFKDRQAQLNAQLDADTTKTGDVVEKLVAELAKLGSVDTRYEAALERIKNSSIKIDFGKIFADMKKEFTAASATLSKTFDSIASIDLSGVKKAFDDLIGGIKAGFAGMPEDVRAEMERLLTTVSQGAYDAKVAELQAEQAAQKDVLPKQEKIVSPVEPLLASTKSFYDLMGEYTQGVGQMFTDLYELSGQKAKEFFYIAKGVAVAEAIVNTANGITKALAQGGAWGIAQAALVGAMGTVQVAKIIASSIKGFATGGSVSGGSGQVDDVPAMLTAGEFVQPRSSVAYYGAQAMEAIRQRMIPREALANFLGNMPNLAFRPSLAAFAAGGMVGGQQQAQGQQIAFQNVNIVDPRLIDQYLASNAGSRMLINWLGNNRDEAKRMLA
jgi:hypothetical protein